MWPIFIKVPLHFQILLIYDFWGGSQREAYVFRRTLKSVSRGLAGDFRYGAITCQAVDKKKSNVRVKFIFRMWWQLWQRSETLLLVFLIVWLSGDGGCGTKLRPHLLVRELLLWPPNICFYLDLIGCVDKTWRKSYQTSHGSKHPGVFPV